MNYCVVYVTVKDIKEAKFISKKILEERYAACVNIVKDITSLYWWEGKITEDNELLLIIKTHYGILDELIPFIKSIHSYTVPEIISIPIKAGSTDYLNWISENTKKTT